MRLAADPCKYSLSSSRPYSVGITNGWPFAWKPTCAKNAASRIASITFGSCEPRLGNLPSFVRGVGLIACVGVQCVCKLRLSGAYLSLSYHFPQQSLALLYSG